MKQCFDLTPEERWERVGELLYKGIYLLAMEEASKYSVTPQIPKEEYTPREASNLMGVSFRTMKRWIQGGKVLAKRKSNGYLMIPRSELAGLSKLRSLRTKSEESMFNLCPRAENKMTFNSN